MLVDLFPRVADNRYPGRRLGLWPFASMPFKIAMGLNVMLNAPSVAKSADGTWPIERSGSPPGTTVNAVLLGIMALGLVLSLWRGSPRSPSQGAGSSAGQPGDPLIEIREEQPGDVEAVRAVNRQAFGQEQEGRIVDALREHGGVLLSLVGVAAGTVVGHILFSPVTVGSVVGAALGPMAVLPEYQRRGIGSRLVEQGIERLRSDGCPFVVVIGHPEFYPRFGFQPAGAKGLSCEWKIPAEAFLVTVLNAEVGAALGGLAKYRPEFSTVE